MGSGLALVLQRCREHDGLKLWDVKVWVPLGLGLARRFLSINYKVKTKTISFTISVERQIEKTTCPFICDEKTAPLDKSQHAPL